MSTPDPQVARDHRIVALVTEADLKRLDDLRRADPAIPSRSSTARALLRWALNEYPRRTT